MLIIEKDGKIAETVNENDFNLLASGGGIDIFIQPTTRRMLLANGICAVEVEENRANAEKASYLMALALSVNPNFNPQGMPIEARQFFV